MGRKLREGASLASALIDRLLHHGEVFYLKGPSWQLKGRALDANGADRPPAPRPASTEAAHA